MVATERPCVSCGKVHSIDDLELTFKRPDVIFALPSAERESRTKETDDLCALDWQRYFVRAVLPLPVHGRDADYCLGVWAEIDEPSFRRIVDTWSMEDQSAEPIFQGTLANCVRGLPDTLGLSVGVQLMGPKKRPRLQVAESGHPLFLEQQNGITAHRASEYTELIDT
jgi:hypothetical protein